MMQKRKPGQPHRGWKAAARKAVERTKSPEDKLKRIAKIYETRRKLPDGSYSSTHAYYNLEGAIIDLERTGKADAIILGTLRRVRAQLAEIGRVLGV